MVPQLHLSQMPPTPQLLAEPKEQLRQWELAEPTGQEQVAAEPITWASALAASSRPAGGITFPTVGAEVADSPSSIGFASVRAS